jgi:hypothetical protein
MQDLVDKQAGILNIFDFLGDEQWPQTK